MYLLSYYDQRLNGGDDMQIVFQGIPGLLQWIQDMQQGGIDSFNIRFVQKGDNPVT